MVYAIIWRGKGAESASWYRPVAFESREKFNEFKTAFEDIQAKYWTYIEEITFAQVEADTPYNDYSGSLE